MAWTAGTGVTNYKIAYQTGASAPADCNSGTTISAATVGNVTSYTVSSLTAGTQYSFRVCSANAAGTLSSGATVTGGYALAGDPSGVTATGASTTSILVSWTAGSNANQYKIAYTTGATAPVNCSSGTQIAAATVGSGTSYTVSSLTAGTQYSFRVCSTNTAGTASSGATTVSGGYPLAPSPTGLGATKPVAGSVKLAWTSGGTGTNRYQIAYQSGSNNAPADCSSGTVVLASTVLSGLNYTISGLTTGTTYSFRVCATNTAGTLNNAGPTVNGTP